MTSDDAKNAAKDIADRATDASNKAAGALKDAAEKGGDRVRDFAARAGGTVGDIYDGAHERIRETAERIPGGASQAMDAGKRVYDRSSETVGRHVVKQPLEALLLAGAIGYLIGWATNRS